MARAITMPQLGESVTEGTIARWLKAEGEEVEKDEPIAEVDTDKVSAELPSPLAGRIERLLVPEGATVEVGAEIALVATVGEGAGDGPAREDARSEGPTEEFPAAGTRAQPVAAGPGESRTAAVGRGEGDGRGARIPSAEELRLSRSSPVVRRLAAEHGVEISEIRGTGVGGRVTKKDIEAYVREREAQPREEAPPRPAPPPPRGRVEVHEGDEVVEVTSVRRAIAERMSRSKREAPHAWTLVEADVSGLVRLREARREEFRRREGINLTYLPFVVRAAVESLKEHPVLNSVWDGERIVLRRRINVGIAVDLEGGALIVPVIKDADDYGIVGLARRIDEVVRKARERRLSPDDVSGGTFTVNNPGALGSVVSTPIINHPQAAILSAEAIVKRPVVLEDDSIAVRSMMNLEVSFDHRILDGGAALRFLNAVKRRLESYTPESGIS
ncbi:lipoamide acyltransferase component of branched-chain alpha-keto acid dehydrogenase complex [Rubrobacter xylanophilus]|uniref:Dihydrolipoamide acetyltransferase component of pyruvate dehydrogenase complex n=1 Tax=Rubrobacter xylanophilus TaxID=49319 RepID=A0A510HMZ8_9ACTN|nr:dihydrolipoamide acetyltransferase family protein [Rubrobacter xylanophilus]BBL79847.1 lipoamide acyltransferase component of branched-chain alpha-keto acid dehydrogenase complex [Rubrobacter xylanophilus]